MSRVHWIRDAAEFLERLRGFAGDYNLGFCRSWEWTQAWWDAFGDDKSLQVAWVAGEDDRPIGYLPMLRELSLAHGRTLRLIGSGTACSDDIGLVALSQRRASVISALTRALLEVPRDLRWDELDWDGVLTSDETTRALGDALVASGCRLRDCGNASVWKLKIEPGQSNPEHYVSHSTVRKYRRLIKRLDGSKFRFCTATDSDSFEAAQERFIDLHQKRRRFLGETGCFANPDFVRFYRTASATLFAQGKWKIFWIERDGQTIAINTGGFDHEGYHVYQTGFDTDASRDEPGWLLLCGLLREAIESQWPAIDMMRGDEPYKRSYGCVATPIRRLRICHPRWSARGRFAAYHLARDAKHWWDSVPNALPSLPAIAATE